MKTFVTWNERLIPLVDHVAAVHGPGWPVESHTSAVDHCRRGPGWDEERADAVDPRQDHSGMCHPPTVVDDTGGGELDVVWGKMS